LKLPSCLLGIVVELFESRDLVFLLVLSFLGGSLLSRPFSLFRLGFFRSFPHRLYCFCHFFLVQAVSPFQLSHLCFLEFSGFIFLLFYPLAHQGFPNLRRTPENCTTMILFALLKVQRFALLLVLLFE
jgi:hypothetical protein